MGPDAGMACGQTDRAFIERESLENPGDAKGPWKR
jgi:hypothetical protein